ncbi:MAG: hypothetical protein ACOC8K_03275, partial [Gemmatimonadota bacterium]
VEELVDISLTHGCCPHKVAMEAAKMADVIVCDYNYLFSDMRERILDALGGKLGDFLVVVDEGVPLRRELYRQWDDAPLLWDSHRVEPHFVHLPSRGDELSGLWAEAAVDGVVLFDPGLDVSRRLVEIRQEIAAGRIVREECHGHPYWVRAA